MCGAAVGVQHPPGAFLDQETLELSKTGTLALRKAGRIPPRPSMKVLVFLGEDCRTRCAQAAPSFQLPWQVRL